MKRIKCCNIVLIVCFVLCGGSVFPEEEGLVSSKMFFSKNVFKHKEDTLVLREIYILESEFSEDNYILGDLISQGFELYDGKWLEHKKVLKRRMFTFRTGFYVDNAIKGEKLSIYLPLTGLPRNIYLNGINIYTAGRYKTDYNTSAYTASNIYLSEDILVYGDALNELAIQGYPEHDQLALGAITISSYYTNESRVFLQNFIGKILISSGVILAFIIFIYFLFLFTTMGFHNFSYLYFGLTCLFFGLSYFNLSFNNDGIPQIIVEKISRCSFPWTVMFVSFFIMEFTNRFNKNGLIKVVISIPVILITTVTAIQEKIAGVAFVFTITMFGIMLPLLIFSIVLLIISLIKDKNKKTVIILFSFAAVILTAIYDIVHVVVSIFPYVYLMQFGFISIVISIFFLLAFDQSKIFIASVQTAKDLNIKNESLKEIVDKIFSVSESLSTSSNRMEDIVETSSGVINQYENDNKEIIDTVLKRLDDVEGMMIKIEERMNISTEKIPQAIINQTSIVEEISATITNMNTHMERTMHSSNESNVAAQQLTGVAEKSRDMISESKIAISKISEYSQFLNDVLIAIENIADKTSILSINAAIEAARQGKQGKGFSVIAGEISTLSLKSKNTLESSFEKIKSMYEIIRKSTHISDVVSESLFSIMGKIKESSSLTYTITELIQEQKYNLSEILISVENLLQDTFTIKHLSEEECSENEKIKEMLSQLKLTFSTVTNLLKNQLTKGSELYTYIGRIKEITNENLQNVKILRKTTSAAD